MIIHTFPSKSFYNSLIIHSFLIDFTWYFVRILEYVNTSIPQLKDDILENEGRAVASHPKIIVELLSFVFVFSSAISSEIKHCVIPHISLEKSTEAESSDAEEKGVCGTVNRRLKHSRSHL